MVALDADEDAAAPGDPRRRSTPAASGRSCSPPARSGTLEPLVTGHAVAGPAHAGRGHHRPHGADVAYARLAAVNGVAIRLGERILGIEPTVTSARLSPPAAGVPTRFVVNAAGVEADRISALAGGETAALLAAQGPVRGAGPGLRRAADARSCSARTRPRPRAVNVVPTTHGSALLGPTALDIADPGDRATDPETDEPGSGQRAAPGPGDRGAYVIKSFAANRPAGDEPHRLRFDARLPRLLHCHQPVSRRQHLPRRGRARADAAAGSGAGRPRPRRSR